ncbi:uncharacterized protein B0P05DRAFT_541661 [Gilbertella persicaria]|uniref:uncharacterized protein n=1 Tax=Gilbertella persicaria TaxID=101096 RepID=UPI00221F77BE|nr:uncharacterized protein B0P05DRAFT_541661 [Gilbertella persicaria]KAI8079705.1 hypothetical protein B0P05DRAFT_541661 [Gilbertella persicaria]
MRGQQHQLELPIRLSKDLKTFASDMIKVTCDAFITVRTVNFVTLRKSNVHNQKINVAFQKITATPPPKFVFLFYRFAFVAD